MVQFNHLCTSSSWTFIKFTELLRAECIRHRCTKPLLAIKSN